MNFVDPEYIFPFQIKVFMKRVTLFLNGATQGGRVVECPDTLEELKEVASEVLGLPPVTHLFLRTGGD